MIKNYKLKIAYDGTRYFGWEHQPGKPTIQGSLEKAISKMCNVPEEDVEINGAGRTDAGVHARAMIASVTLSTSRSCDSILEFLNKNLPSDISVMDVKEASDRFHARYNAVGKTYMYTIYNGPSKPIFDRKFVTVVDTPLDIDAMKKAAGAIIGEHDFKCFCGNSHFKKSCVRIVDKAEIRCSKGYIYITFHGTGFLQNMVRIMTGTLIEIGAGRMDVDAIPAIIEKKDRNLAGPTAPAKGLCLIEVDY
jgi:tRNA pseudouridine38-40 synthase